MAGTRVLRESNSYAAGENSGIASGVRNYTGPASYPTGGMALALKTDESLVNDPFDVQAESSTTATGAPSAHTLAYDYTAKKIVAYVRTTGVEVANTTDLSALTFRVSWRSAQ